MTSQQLKAKLQEAVSMIEECERLFEGPEASLDSWDAVALKDRVRDFMDLHRDELREGGVA